MTQGAETDAIPAQLPPNYALSAKDGLAMVSFLAFGITPMVASMYGVEVCLGVVNGVPIRDQLHGARDWLFTGSIIVAATAAVFVGKYLWLIAMCRILGRVNVGWLIAYGIPRRISRFDQTLIRRFYQSNGPVIATRLRPPKPIGYLYRLQGAGYATGAILSAGLGFLPLMHGDHRPWQIAAFLMALALLHIPLARWAGRKKP